MSEGNGAADAPLMVTVSGLRGIVGQSLTPRVVSRYAGALAGLAREGCERGRPLVVLGRDGRAGGEAIARLAGGALMASGCDVVDLGVAMTPTVGVMVGRLDADAGLVVTASHNPGEWNGLKPITRLGGAPSPDTARTLIKAFDADDTDWAERPAVGRLREDTTADEAHATRVVEALASFASLDLIRQHRFRVVLDSVNASGGAGGRRLLELLGCAVIHLNNDDTGIFPHPPEPTEAHLVDLCTQVADADAAVGFAQDPDADRLAIIDSDGRYIGEESTLALCSMSYLEALGGAEASRVVLAANLSTSRMIDDVAARFEARVVRTPVGEANVVAGMREAGCTLGGEGNGGVVWMDIVPIRDSLGSMALVLALMARYGGSLGEALRHIPTYAIEKRKTAGGDGLDDRITEGLKAEFAGGDGLSVDERDGLRLDFDAPEGDGRAWVHVRASNTEPILRLIAEAPTSAQASAILDRAERVMQGS